MSRGNHESDDLNLHTYIDGVPDILEQSGWQSSAIVISDLAECFSEERVELEHQDYDPEYDRPTAYREFNTWRVDINSRIGYALATTVRPEFHTANFIRADLSTGAVEGLVHIGWRDTSDPSIFLDAHKISTLKIEEKEILDALIHKTIASIEESDDRYKDEEVINVIDSRINEYDDPALNVGVAQVSEHFEDGTVGNVYEERHMLERAARATLRKYAKNELGNIELAVQLPDSPDKSESAFAYIRAWKGRKGLDHDILVLKGVRKLIGSEVECVDLNHAEAVEGASEEDLSEFELNPKIMLRILEEGVEMPVDDYNAIEEEPEEYLSDSW